MNRPQEKIVCEPDLWIEYFRAPVNPNDWTFSHESLFPEIHIALAAMEVTVRTRIEGLERIWEYLM